MKRAAMIALVAMTLGACQTTGSVPPPVSAPRLPEVPADIKRCFVGVVEIPDRDLTIGEIEKFWASDRVRSAAQARCGKRLIAWVEKLRAEWN